MHTLRWLSLATLLALALTAALIGLNVFTTPRGASYGPIALQLVYVLVSMTATGLSFAAGIVGLILALRRRQWGWCAAILLPVLIENYGPRAFFIDGQMDALVGVSQQNYNILLLIITVLLPALTPLMTLLYSRPLRAARQPKHGLDDLDLEFTSLDQPRP